MISVGMNFAGHASTNALIEETLVHASRSGMEDDDLRVLAVLTSWMAQHHAHVNVDRLVRSISADPSPRVRAYWAAVAEWLQKDRRFSRVAKLYTGSVIDLLAVGTDFQLSRRGEDPRFSGSVLRVPQGTLRDREADVVPPAEMVKRHAGYRNRVRFGPGWRADVWTVLEQNSGLSVAEVARRVGCAFATAWEVAQDYELLRAADTEASSS
jgi:hypothetical protein